MADYDQSDLALDVLPSSDDAGVQTCAEHLKENFKLQQYIQTLMVVAKYLYISTLALSKDAQLLIKTQEALFQVLKVCDTSSIMVQQFQSGANNILEKLKIAYLYLLDGFPEAAQTDIEATKSDVDSMRNAVVKTKNALNGWQKNMEDVVEKELGPNLKKVDQELKEAVGGLNETEWKVDTDHQAKRDGRERGRDETEMQPICGERVDAEGRRVRQSRQAYWTNIFAAILVYLILLIVVVVALDMMNYYLQIWSFLVNDVYPVLIFLTLTLLIVQLVVLCIAIGILNRNGLSRLLLLYGILIVFIVVSEIILVISEIAGYANKSLPASYHVWFSIVLLIILILEFVVIGFCNAWTRNKQKEETCIDQETPQRRYYDRVNVVTPKVRSDAIQNRSHCQVLEQKSSRFTLSDAVLNEAITNSGIALSLLEGLMPVVEGWLEECTNVLEPAMNRGIKMAEGLPEEEKTNYWNSLMFKKEVIGYYCRWRALQVYADNIRPKLKATRQQIEQFYTDNPLPDEAIQKAWEVAAEDSVPEIREIVRKYNTSSATATAVIHLE